MAGLFLDDLVRDVAAVVGGAGDRTGVVLVILDYSSHELDEFTAITVWSAILSSLGFGSPSGRFPPLIPSSCWWEAGLPLRLAASRPTLPDVAGGRQLALELCGLTELLPPTHALDDVVRVEVARRLSDAGVADSARFAESLTNVHDLRGLAAALVGVL